MENQVRHIADIISKRSQASLPSNTKANLKGQEKVMTLQSGKEAEKDKAHIGKKNDEEVIEEIEVVQLLI